MILVVLSLISVVQCVPFIETISDSSNLNHQKLDTSIEKALNYRLPNNSLPISYDLWLKTDVEKMDFNLSGRVKIHIKIIEETREITLHMRQLTIDKIDLRNVDDTLAQENLEHVYDEPVEFLRISLPNISAVDDEIILDISYHGTLREDALGFYRASYRNATGDVVWYATTQFQQTDARHALPCYDEPAIRAVYTVQIQHNKLLDAISNMPIIARIPVEGTDYVTSKFQETLPMQSYLLAFIVSDFTFKSNNDASVEQRIYAPAHRIERGDGDFSLEVVGPVLRKMEEHFQISYPLPKLDHAAITDYVWGAMENFGLVTYQDSNIMFNRKLSMSSSEEKVIEIIAHELAHQYFGNIVAPQWWSYTWLNEAFATFFEFYIPSLVFPENKHMEEFAPFIQMPAFELDSNPASPPLSAYAETADEIKSKFDLITYYKGACVVRMFHEALTPQTFTKGLRYYLKELYFKSATPQDLHRNLQRAYDEDFPQNKVNINDVMTTWEDQAGFPIINVTKRDGVFILEQSRFRGGNEVYSIPLTYLAQSEAKLDKNETLIWFNNASTEVESDDDWIILDVFKTGFFKVSYDTRVLKAIIKDLPVINSKLPAFHRRQLVQDTRSYLNENRIEGFYALEHLSSLRSETNSKVWFEGYQLEIFTYGHLFGSQIVTKYHKFIQDIISEQISRLGFDKVDGESSNDSELRKLVASLSCKSLQKECLTYELNRLVTYVQTGLGSYDLCHGLRNANETVHSLLIEEALDLDESAEKYNLIFNLGCPLKRELIENYLNVLIDDTIELDGYERKEGIIAVPGKSSIALEVVLDFLKTSFHEIEKLIPSQLFNISNAMKYFITSESNWEKFKEVLELMHDAKYLTTDNIEQISEAVELNLKWTAENLEDIEAWLNGENPATDPTEDSTTLGSSSLVSSVVTKTFCLLGIMIST